MKKLLMLFAMVFLLAACGSNDKKSEPETEVEDQTSEKTLDENELKEYASNITGGTFVKSISLTNNQSDIEFYNNFNEFKNDNPNSFLTEDDYNGYFDTEETIEKILVIENIRLLRQFPDLTGANMSLPFGGKTYSIKLDRESINNHLGFKVEELKTEDDSWTTEFVNPIGYNETKRKDIMNKFGEIN